MRGSSDGDGPGTTLAELAAEGVSSWWQGIHRSALDSGWFTATAGTAGLRGATTDLAVLLAELRSDGAVAYDRQVSALAAVGTESATAAGALLRADARSACDVLLPVFQDTEGHDGWVSVDLPPDIAHDRRATVSAAKAVTAGLDRPNALVKIPATVAGVAAVRECLALGIGVHVAEVFSPTRYGQVVDACLDGLEQARTAGVRLDALAAVVALPVGPLSAAVADQVDETGRIPAGLAVARLLFHDREQRLGTTRWRALRTAGARQHRLLWTDLGDRAADLDRLVGWGSVVALGGRALEALASGPRLHGDTLLGAHDAARAALDGLAGLGVDFAAVERRLEHDRAHRQVRLWTELCEAVGTRLSELKGSRIS